MLTRRAGVPLRPGRLKIADAERDRLGHSAAAAAPSPAVLALMRPGGIVLTKQFGEPGAAEDGSKPLGSIGIEMRHRYAAAPVRAGGQARLASGRKALSGLPLSGRLCPASLCCRSESRLRAAAGADRWPARLRSLLACGARSSGSRGGWVALLCPPRCAALTGLVRYCTIRCDMIRYVAIDAVGFRFEAGRCGGCRASGALCTATGLPAHPGVSVPAHRGFFRPPRAFQPTADYAGKCALPGVGAEASLNTYDCVQ